MLDNVCIQYKPDAGLQTHDKGHKFCLVNGGGIAYDLYEEDKYNNGE